MDKPIQVEQNQTQTQFNFMGKPLRTVIIDGEPWFVANDACDILEIDNTQTRRLDDDEKGLYSIQTPGGYQPMLVVNEPGLYSLVFGSRKPEAKQFKRWITHEVIPSIRKHGAYMTPQKIEEILLNPDTVIQLATALKEEREKNRALLPKAESFDTFMDAKNNQTMNVVAKSLGVGRNKLFDLLRQHKVFMANNTPFQTYIERGYFEVKEKPITMGDNTFNKPQTFVTAKGVVFLEKFLKEKVVLV